MPAPSLPVELMEFSVEPEDDTAMESTDKADDGDTTAEEAEADPDA